ncbi:hypothetical protein Anapl_08581 [Anas platyrhynchos]|uniref:Uncharacterized protein n=1 Tax=Anas platyrhynchos TaxID=8839 RepID=R0K8K9_ANAPL|nr:hypothetical protein Anapl_08581 [Anas platyrhynchos]
MHQAPSTDRCTSSRTSPPCPHRVLSPKACSSSCGKGGETTFATTELNSRIAIRCNKDCILHTCSMYIGDGPSMFLWLLVTGKEQSLSRTIPSTSSCWCLQQSACMWVEKPFAC